MFSYIVSACLAGVCCRYDGTHNLCAPVLQLVEQGKALTVCPELLANLPTPRNPVEICNRLILDAHGSDFTAQFLQGAKKALDLCKKNGCTSAILKSNSPSCGRDYVYDGTFSRKLVKGQGVFAKLLTENNIKIYTEKDLPPEI